MGYFSNGTEAQAYQERWCYRCVHWTDEHGCPCWMAHSIWNYEECMSRGSILHKMIPRSEDGLTNGQCFAFTDRCKRTEATNEPTRPHD